MARKRIVKNMSLQEQAAEILRRATEKGVDANFFFVTKFSQYNTQLQIMEELKKEIKANGSMVKKTYVKGRENLMINPAIDGFNKTVTASNGTVQTLIAIIEKLGQEQVKESKLFKLMEEMGDE